MKITDVITITELSRLLNKSRPTLYKYISDFEQMQFADIPEPIVKLFNNIASGSFGKKDIYTYCDMHFTENDTLNEIFTLIKENVSRLDLNKLKDFIKKELM